MYYNDGGDNWVVNTSWAENENHGTWEGVTCSSTSDVSELALENNQLSGEISTWFE